MKLSFSWILFIVLLGNSFTSMANKTLQLDVYPTSKKGMVSGNNIFFSIEEARNYIRTLSKEKRNRDIEVFVHNGTFFLSNTVVFDLRDSGIGGNKITYRAAPNEQPIFSSGIAVASWTPLKKRVNGLKSECQGKIWVANFPDNVDSVRVLYDGSKRLLRSRSHGFNHKMQKAPRFASRNIAKQKDRFLLKKMPFPEGLIQKGDQWSDIEFVFCPVPWAHNIIGVDSVDFDNHIAWLKYEANSAPFTTPKDHHPAYAENAIRFLDSPGEWYADHKNRKIYYWPKNHKPSGGEVIPTLTELFKVEGKVNYNSLKDIPVKNIYFDGLTFSYGNRYDWWKGHKGWGIQHDWDKFDCPNALLRFRAAESCGVTNCRFTNSGNSAIRLDLYAQDIQITNNLIDHVGHMGILLAGYGPGKKDVNKNNHIENNIIDHCGEVIYHGHAIFMWQSGNNYVGHNLIQNCPRKAIGICGVRAPIFIEGESVDWDEASKTLRWSEIDQKLRSKKGVTQESILPYLHAKNNVVEYNDIYRTRVKIGDGASLNVSGAGEGNIMRKNMLVEVVGNGMRTDDWQRGTCFESNIIASGGVVHKGCNHLKNNIFLNSTVRFTSYPRQVKKSGAEVVHNIFYFDNRAVVPYSSRKIKQFTTPFDICENKQNLFWCTTDQNIEKDFLNKMQMHKDFEKGSVVSDPLFVKALPKYRRLRKEDIQLKASSPAYKIGFEKIDNMSIGLKSNYPMILSSKVMASVNRRLISTEAKVTYSSVDRTSKSYESLLLSSGSEKNVEYVFESKKEKNPYLQLDLGVLKRIDAMKIISTHRNGLTANREMTVWISSDGDRWREVWCNDIDEIKVGRSWDIILDSPLKAQYIRVGLKGSGKLCMKNLQLYQNL
ncbi:right-handed parallel beta-helix repeat-containing protein [Halosquirtibacter laminarini]|uniref:Right-handed parallel beta-helix repeat-containing protein n=1 Tax=Halosquirtibacter laminarini TaxID=3374600 RepID=A0AC61NJX5_9BACT|nr:right-handed parallel beta-helix repeat-containing protein [Prolixibacteraceae bacterium]